MGERSVTHRYIGGLIEMMCSTALTHPTSCFRAFCRKGSHQTHGTNISNGLRFARSSCVLLVDEVLETPMLDELTLRAPRPSQSDSRNTHRLFYLTTSLLMFAVVTYGFSRTIGPDLLHTQRPTRTIVLLSIHGAVFYG
jgi:hypothetical protein